MSPKASSSLAITSPTNKSALVRTRRSQGKSRFGCIRCKISRVKCDENKPECSRCLNFSEPCVYPTTQTSKWKASTSTLVLTPIKKNKPPTKKTKHFDWTIAPSCSTVEFVQKFRQPDPAQVPPHLPALPKEHIENFDTQDAFLLLHFTSSTSCGLWGSQKTWVEQGVPLAFQNPFLMHAVMCLTARHLQTLPDSPVGYSKSNYSRLEAFHYQRALSIYSSSFALGLQNNRQAFLAASFIFAYYSCSLQDFKPTRNSTSTASDDSSITFIRGIRTIVHSLNGYPLGLMQSLVFPIPGFPQGEPTSGPGKRLLSLLDSRPLSPSLLQNRELYVERIYSLTPYLATCTQQDASIPPAGKVVRCFLRWQSFCPAEFVEAIRTYDKVALVILAHYYAAANCHTVRMKDGWWWWREKPAYMVQTILDYLDGEWDEWLEWPRTMLQIARDYKEL